MRIVFIGAGNLATHLSLAMQKAGMDIVQVYNLENASLMPFGGSGSFK